MIQFGIRQFSIKVGDKLPSASISVVKYNGEKFDSEIIKSDIYFANKTAVLVGYPGAFTPTCQNQHIPGFIEHADQIKAEYVDEIIAMSVNDPFVIKAFAEKLGGGKHINYIADGHCELTNALGLGIDRSVWLGGVRTKRFSMIVKNNEIIKINNEEGTGLTEISDAKTILTQLKL